MCRLLDLDGCASSLKILLELCGFVLADGFLDHGWCGLDQILGFLEAKAGDGADNLDDFDFLLACSLEADRELGLLFDGSGRTGGWAIGAAAETPNFSSSAWTSSITSTRDLPAIASMISSLLRDMI